MRIRYTNREMKSPRWMKREPYPALQKRKPVVRAPKNPRPKNLLGDAKTDPPIVQPSRGGVSLRARGGIGTVHRPESNTTTRFELHVDTFERYANQSHRAVGQPTIATLAKTFGGRAFGLGAIKDAYEAAKVEAQKAGEELGRFRYENCGVAGPYERIWQNREAEALALKHAYEAVRDALKNPIAYRELVTLETTLHPSPKSLP